MSTTIQVSIIIVTFNAGKTLQKALDSIFNQTYQNIELVIIDGLSTDNTVEILKSNNSNITFWKSEKDSGIYDAMNKALEYTNGERIFFLGADDFLLPDFSLMCEKLIDESVIYLGLVKFKEKLLGRQISAYSLSKVNIIHQSMFYPKSVFTLFKYNLCYPIYADYYLNIQCYNFYSFKFIKLAVAEFADGGISSIQLDNNFIKNKKLIVYKYLPKITFIRFLLRRLRKKILK